MRASTSGGRGQSVGSENGQASSGVAPRICRSPMPPTRTPARRPRSATHSPTDRRQPGRPARTPARRRPGGAPARRRTRRPPRRAAGSRRSPPDSAGGRRPRRYSPPRMLYRSASRRLCSGSRWRRSARLPARRSRAVRPSSSRVMVRNRRERDGGFGRCGIVSLRSARMSVSGVVLRSVVDPHLLTEPVAMTSTG